MKVDRRNRLFVAGGGTGTASVYNARNGRLLREYTLTAAPRRSSTTSRSRAARRTSPTRSSGSCTCSTSAAAAGCRPPRARSRSRATSQDIPDPGGFELNGIAAAGRGRLVTVDSALAKLFLVDARSGDTDEIELTGGDVANGDGLLLRGRRLYAVQNQLNRIAVIHLKRGLRSGEVKRHLTDSDFDVPTTVAAGGSASCGPSTRASARRRRRTPSTRW